LSELGQLAGGMDYAAVAQAVSRFRHRAEQQRELRRKVAQMEAELSHVAM
jgi:hypothetical protein